MELFSCLIVLNVKFDQRIKKKNVELSNRKICRYNERRKTQW